MLPCYEVFDRFGHFRSAPVIMQPVTPRGFAFCSLFLPVLQTDTTPTFHGSAPCRHPWPYHSFYLKDVKDATPTPRPPCLFTTGNLH